MEQIAVKIEEQLLPADMYRMQSELAIANPRPGLKEIAQKLADEIDWANGEGYYYYWPVKEKVTDENGKDHWRTSMVKGGSIDLAMSIVRCWKNCATEASVVAEDADSWTMIGTFIDFENRTAIRRTFRQRKIFSMGKMEKDRALDMSYQVGQSKVQRNVVLRAIPRIMVDRLVEMAITAAIRQFKSPEGFKKAKHELFLWARKNRITEKQLEKIIGDLNDMPTGKPMDIWTPEDIVQMRGIAKAISDKSLDVATLLAGKGEIKAITNGTISEEDLMPKEETKKGYKAEFDEPEQEDWLPEIEESEDSKELKKLISDRGQAFRIKQNMTLLGWEELEQLVFMRDHVNDSDDVICKILIDQTGPQDD